MRSPLLLVTALFAAVAAPLVGAIGAAGNRVLAILDDVAEKEAYSQFLSDLEGRGFEIAYTTPKSESTALFQHGVRTCDHLIFFPTKIKGLGPNLTPGILIKFINDKGNILIAQSSNLVIPPSLISLLSELDIFIPPDRTGLVVDHFQHDVASAAEAHDVLLLPPPGPLREGVRGFFRPDAPGDEVLAFPRGLGHILSNNPLLAPILRAPRSAYVYNPSEQAHTIDPDELFAAGSQLGLVTAMQARNSGRVAVVGSAEMLSDQWFDAVVKKTDGTTTRTWNREFAKKLSAWTFHEIGVLRVNSIEHHSHDPRNQNVSNPTMYLMGTEVTYSVSLSEYAWDGWVPFTPPAGDEVQLEFSMLSPYIRKTLEPVATTGHETTYSATLRIPDQHGIFNLMLNYKRPFLTNVVEKRTVTVRHIAHDEYPPSWQIPASYPWLSGIWTVGAGFVAFCIVWMFSQPMRQAGEQKKTQ